MAYYNVEPFGERRAEQRNGLLCSLVVNSHCDAQAKPEDFMYGVPHESEKPLTDEEVEEQLNKIFR